MQHAFGHSAVAEESHRYAAGAAQLMRQRAAERERQTTADDAVRTEHSDP